MYLKQIEIKNFKTYKDLTTIEFSNDVVKIEGANGCGKTNLFDCIEFALGWKISRIYTNHDLLGQLSTFRNNKDVFVRLTFADNQETFTIARKLEKLKTTCRSTYYLNDEPVSHSVIDKKLRNYNLNNKNNLMSSSNIKTKPTISSIYNFITSSNCPFYMLDDIDMWFTQDHCHLFYQLLKEKHLQILIISHRKTDKNLIDQTITIKSNEEHLSEIVTATE